MLRLFIFILSAFILDIKIIDYKVNVQWGLVQSFKTKDGF